MSNSIFVISPYKHDGVWVFDDDRRELYREAFVGGTDAIIDAALREKGIKNADDGFVMLFSDHQFPGSDFRLDWVKADFPGNIYSCDFDSDGVIEGWLCAALGKYFREAPKAIYVQIQEKG